MLTAILILALSAPHPSVSPEEAPLDPDYDTLVWGGIGGAGSDKAGGPTGVVALSHRLEALEVGVELCGVAALFDYSLVSVGAHGGVHFGERLSVSFLGAGGLHSYEGVGRGWLFSDDPGANGTTPYLGGRLVATYRLGRKQRAFIGALALLDEDLTRRTVHYSYTETGWFSGESHVETNSATIGQRTYGVAIVGGAQFDLTPY